LSEERVLAPTFQEAWWDERRDAFPDPGPLDRPQQLFRVAMQWRRQLPEHFHIAVTDQGDLDISGTAFGPRSSEGTDRPLCAVPQSCPRINDDVVEVAVAVEIHRDRVGVVVVIVEWSPVLVFAGQFRAMNSTTITHTTDDGTMEQLRLRQGARTGRQRGPIATRGRERQQHGRQRIESLLPWSLGNPDL
jgi:hypothetical protein